MIASLHLICIVNKGIPRPAFLPVSTGWFSVSVWQNNLGLQVSKPVLFSTAYEGLQNFMLCC